MTKYITFRKLMEIIIDLFFTPIETNKILVIYKILLLFHINPSEGKKNKTHFTAQGISHFI